MTAQYTVGVHVERPGEHALRGHQASMTSGRVRRRPTSQAVAISVLALAMAGTALANPAGAKASETGRALNPRAGTPQFPTLLAAYPARPSWRVAGVDYQVGTPSGTVLKDPLTLKLPGVSVNVSQHTVVVTGAAVVLDGYDFSLEGGWNVYVEGANDVIQNSNFKVGVNNLVPIQGAAGASNLSIAHTTIDGGGLGVVGNPGAIWSLISYLGNGLNANHNWLKYAPQHIIEVRGGRLVEKRNLINNLGYAPGAHPNAVQFCGGVSSSSVVSYNTIYNPQPVNGYPNMNNEDLQVEGQCSGTVLNTTMTNNVVIAVGGSSMTSSYLVAVRQDPGGNVVSGVKVESNYLDASGAYGPFYPPSGSNLVFANNIDLKTGTPLTEPGAKTPNSAARIAVGREAAALWLGLNSGGQR